MQETGSCSEFLATVCKTVRPMHAMGPLSCQLSCPVCNVGVLWPNGWTDADGTQVGLGPGHMVLTGDTAPPPSNGHSLPIFCLYLLLSNGCMDQNATWMEVGLSPGELC